MGPNRTKGANSLFYVDTHTLGTGLRVPDSLHRGHTQVSDLIAMQECGLVDSTPNWGSNTGLLGELGPVTTLPCTLVSSRIK